MAAACQALAERTYEFSEYLVDVLGVTDLGACYPGQAHLPFLLPPAARAGRGPPAARTCWQTCTALSWSSCPDSQECCGFGGVFSVEHPEISAAMLERKMANVEASQAPLVVSCDAGCITNINGGLHRQGQSPAGGAHR